MKASLLFRAAVAWTALGLPAWASESPSTENAAETAKAEKLDEKLSRSKETLVPLPKPLDDVLGNLNDLEKNGYFKVLKGRYGRSHEQDEPALVWTVEVLKPLRCRHAMILLRQLGDVRFYWLDQRTERTWCRELLSKEMYYSSEIASGAVRRELLHRYEWFEIWIPLEPSELAKLKRRKVNRVVFRPLKR